MRFHLIINNIYDDDEDGQECEAYRCKGIIDPNKSLEDYQNNYVEYSKKYIKLKLKAKTKEVGSSSSYIYTTNRLGEAYCDGDSFFIDPKQRENEFGLIIANMRIHLMIAMHCPKVGDELDSLRFLEKESNAKLQTTEYWKIGKWPENQFKWFITKNDSGKQFNNLTFLVSLTFSNIYKIYILLTHFSTSLRVFIPVLSSKIFLNLISLKTHT